MERKFGALSSSINPQEMAKTAEGVIKAIGGALVFWGVSSVTDINTLAGNIGALVTLGYSMFGLAETAFGILRKIVVAIQARLQLILQTLQILATLTLAIASPVTVEAKNILPPILEAPPLSVQALAPAEIVKTPREWIIYYSEKYEVDPRLPLAIACAESGLGCWSSDEKAIVIKNPVGTASGILQFLDSTFLAQCRDKYKIAESLEQKNDPKIQAECAVRMIADGGESHWSASRHNWSDWDLYMGVADLTP